MNYKSVIYSLCIILFFSCKKDIPQNLYKIEGKQIGVSDSLETNTEIEAFIKPYREHVNKGLDSALAYSKKTYSKTDGKFNTAIGNLFADVVYEQANPVFKKRTGKNIDMVMLNHGGIRSIISKGPITTRTAYQIMPFENAVVVVALPGKNIIQLTEYLAKAKRAHPISGLKLALNADFTINSALINTKPIDTTKTYYIATNDYLYNGGDRMTFFKPNDSLIVLDYKIRNALIDYFKKVDTINPVIDDRFTILKN